MNDFLPLFPLKLVVFPGEQLNLHIFEPRYKQLIRECEQNKITFGIPAFIDEQVMEIGTELKLLSIEKRYDNGEMDIKTQGIGLFKIKELFHTAPNKLYAGADIQRFEFDTESDPYLCRQIMAKLKTLFEILKIKKSLPANEDEYSTFEVAHHVGFSLEQEYQFLCLLSEEERQAFINDHLGQLIPVVREMEQLKEKVRLNGHFKNLNPPKF